MADPRIARIAATLNAAAAAASITIKAQLDTIGDAAVAEVAALFPDWAPGVAVQPGVGVGRDARRVHPGAHDAG